VRIRNPWLVLLLAAGLGAAPAGSEEVLRVGAFSTDSEGSRQPAGWKPLVFRKIERHTVYSLVKEDETVVVKAVSDAAASGLTKETTINLKDYPFIQWRWKVLNILKQGDVHRKDGDDYPARLYITFRYDPAKLNLFEKAKYEAARLIYGEYPPVAAITYIWESKSPVGTVVSNPYTERVKMIVVESGSSRLKTWITEERDLYTDYRQAFGEEPPAVSGVAIMTDTDNTGESATAYYGDIVFKKARA
jgi:hypothetical protein